MALNTTIQADQTSQATTQTPVRDEVNYCRRPWEHLPVDLDSGKYKIGKDGVTADEMWWYFNPASGAFHFAQPLEMVGQQDKLTGQWSKPRPRITQGMQKFAWLNEARFGWPIFTYAETEAIYAESCAKQVPIKVLVVKKMDPDTSTAEMLRQVAGAPSVICRKEDRVAEKRRESKDLDEQVKKFREMRI